jgi:hypothetical protein
VRSVEDRIIGFLVRVGGKWYIRRRIRANSGKIALAGAGAAVVLLGAVAVGVASQRQPV